MNNNKKNNTTMKKFKNLAACAMLAGMLGTAGAIEWADDTVYHMPDEAYTAIKSKLGSDAGNMQIAREYIENREYYNNLDK